MFKTYQLIVAEFKGNQLALDDDGDLVKWINAYKEEHVIAHAQRMGWISEGDSYTVGVIYNYPMRRCDGVDAILNEQGEEI